MAKQEIFIGWVCCTIIAFLVYAEYRRVIADFESPSSTKPTETPVKILEPIVKPEPLKTFFSNEDFVHSTPFKKTVLFALNINAAPTLAYEVPQTSDDESNATQLTLYQGIIKIQVAPRTPIPSKLLQLGILYLIICEPWGGAWSTFPIDSDKFTLDLKLYPLKPRSCFFLHYRIWTEFITETNRIYQGNDGLARLMAEFERLARTEDKIKETILVSIGVEFKSVTVGFIQ